MIDVMALLLVVWMCFRSIPRFNKLASLEATLVRNYDPLTDLLTGVKCRATSVAKKKKAISMIGIWLILLPKTFITQ